MMPSPVEPRPKWYHGPWFILLMLFFVLGPLGLPLLWRSPWFSKKMKIALTVAVVLYTAALLMATDAVMRKVYESLEKTLAAQ